MTVRITVNVQYYYDVTEEDLEEFYFTTDPFVAAEVDKTNLVMAPYLVAQDIQDHGETLVIRMEGERLPDVLPST